MAIRKVMIWPDPVLSTKAKSVAVVDSDRQKIVRDMFDTMYFANGVGLAAPQIGLSERILVIDLNPRGHRKGDALDELHEYGFTGPQAFINPEIIHEEGSIIWEEGCLSVPGVNDDVKRAETITVRALNVEGQVFEKTVSGLYSVALQHEIDHLEGKVFVEYLSRLKRELIKKKMVKIQRNSDDYYAEKAAERDEAEVEAAAL